MSSPGSIFISYRRSDSRAETERIYDRLVAEFGRDHVYKDMDSIPLGFDFAEELDKAVGQCQVLLVIIGKTWVSVTEADGAKRLDNPDDFVRIEVESALKRNIPVIPVLLEGASMPKRVQLPKSLHTLARRNGTQVGYDPRFHTDMNRLVKALRGLIKATPTVIKVPPGAGRTRNPTPSPQSIVNKSTQASASKTIDLDNGATLELVNIPGGVFLMGSPEGKGRNSERPQHNITVPEFLMGKYLVTQAQYKAVTGSNPSHFKGDDLPVERVSWYDAVVFCEKLSQRTGQAIRLPSEAEWEYACRAETTTRYYFGENISSEQANFHGIKKGTTTSVGSYPASAFGLYDMHGNVWEWCQDHWHKNYEGAPTDGSAWLTDNEEAKRVLRGGSWGYNPRNCRSAYRGTSTPDKRYYGIGFRVVCSAPRISE